MRQLVKQALVEKYGEGKVPKGFKMPLVDGDDKDYKGYQNHYSIKQRQKRPTLVYRDKTRLSKKTAFCTAVCYVNASIDDMGNGQFLR